MEKQRRLAQVTGGAAAAVTMAVDVDGVGRSRDRRAVQWVVSARGGRQRGRAHIANKMGGLDHSIQELTVDDNEADSIGKIDGGMWLRRKRSEPLL
ncbi:hypothetical protein ACLOJK_034193 [Asimina triloba]